MFATRSSGSVRLGLASLVGGFCLVQSLALAADHTITNANDAQTTVSRMLANKTSLGDAVKAAEKHCKGNAIAAHVRHLNGDRSADIVIDVTVLDESRVLKLVTVDGSGRITHMKDWTSASSNDGTSRSATRSSDSGSWSSADQERYGALAQADEVIGKSIVNLQGESLGKVEDLAIDPLRGRIGYAVVSFGGFLGINNKLFAVPWTSLNAHNADRYVLDVPQDRLREAPGFENNQWPDMNDLRWNETIHAYYNQPNYWNDSRDANNRSAQITNLNIHKVSDILGMKVTNPQDENLGEIENLTIEPGSGRIRYAVVGVGGFLGMGETNVVVPYSALRYDHAASKMNLDITKDRLKNAPRYDKKNPQNFNDRAWGEQTHRYYAQDPYWLSPSDRSRTTDGTPTTRP